MPGGKAGLKTLNQCLLDKGTMDVGCQIELRFHSLTDLTVIIDGKQYAVINNPALCWAIWDMFFGPLPVSPEAKSIIADEFAKQLARDPVNPFT